jgi:putative ABC transport system permease protein
MIFHYLKTGLRSLVRQKVYSLINILGLGTGIASFILILLFLQNELSYERHIPESADIYRLVEIQTPAGIDVQHVAITSGPWAPTLKDNLPELEEAVRMMPVGGRVFRAEDKIIREGNCYYADPSVFRMFHVRLRDGNPETALSEPNTAVLSVSLAERLFETSDVMGKTFRFGETPFVVTGIMHDYDHNSHLKLPVLLSYATAEAAHPELQHFGNNSMATYLLLGKGTKKEQAEENIRALIDDQMTQMGLHDVPRPQMYLQPMQDIYLKSQHIKFSIYNAKGDINLVYIFSAVAILVLLIACINFINLSTARSSKRSLEVGIRKVVGAKPVNLVTQFLGESVIITFLGLVVAVGLVELFLPDFNSLLGTDLHVDFLGNWIFNIGLLGLLLVVGFIAGIYPALYLSRFKPLFAIGAKNTGGGSATGTLRKVLVIFQFTISTLLVFSTLIIYTQWVYMRSKDLGISYEDVVSVRILQRQTDEIVLQNLKSELLTHPGITGAAVSSGVNGVGFSQGTVTALDSVEVALMVRFGFVDEEFFPLMEVPLVQGRNFSRDYRMDASRAAILNQAAVRALGWTDAIGKRFRVGFIGEEPFTVVGVIRDYNYFSLENAIEPAFYVVLPERFNTLVVKINPLNREEAMGHLEATWASAFQDLPFEAEFATETIMDQYDRDSNIMKVVSYFAVLCIIISALGLYGLAAFVAEQKKREIGIRKVLGDSVTGVVMHLQKDFMKLVGIALVISLPLAWYSMGRYLENYAYRISQNWWHFAVTIAMVTLIAFLTIFYHAYKAALANPVDSIKAE